MNRNSFAVYKEPDEIKYIFHSHISGRNFGPPFKTFHLLRKFFRSVERKLSYHLRSDRNFRYFRVNGRQLLAPHFTIPTINNLSSQKRQMSLYALVFMEK